MIPFIPQFFFTDGCSSKKKLRLTIFPTNIIQQQHKRPTYIPTIREQLYARIHLKYKFKNIAKNY
jgi:uncharacterized membrane protein